MTNSELQSFRRRLSVLAARLRGGVIGLRGEALDTPDAAGQVAEPSPHAGDAASHAADRNVTLSLLESDESLLAEVEAALARTADGNYGVCSECGKSIPKTRLRALPYARFCLKCAERHEAETSA